MKVILLERIANLGGLGDEVNVKAGYGRNYLIPYGKAVIANAANQAEFEARRAELEKAAADQLAAAKARAEKLAALTVELAAQASDEGKLFGSVGPRDIAEAVSAKGVALEKSEVLMPEGPIRQIGEYTLELKLHSDVIESVVIKVIAAE